MRILFIVNVPSPYRVDFFNVLGKMCDLTVLFETRSARSRDSAWVADKIQNFIAVVMKGIRIGEAEALCPEVLKYLSKKKYDIIIVGYYASITGMLAIEYMRLMHIPYILSTDGGMKKSDLGIKHKIKKHFISGAVAWLSTGKITQEYLTYYGADIERIYKYPFTSVKKQDILSVPLSNVEKQFYRDKLNMIEKRIVLSVGQFIYRKGYDILLRSCKGLNKSIGIYIVGGKVTEEYLKIQKELELTNVHFVDFINKGELVDYYKAAELFVLPTREDIWGLVINEAMSYGLPVITTDKCVAGLEMVGDAGKIVAVESDWGEEILSILNSGELQDLAKNSLKTAKKYTIEEMADIHVHAFEHIRETIKC